MIISETPPTGESQRRTYPQALCKRAMATVAAFLVAAFSVLVGATVTTTVSTNNHVAYIFNLSPCGDQPGICP
jgi:hypothetical protein